MKRSVLMKLTACCMTGAMVLGSTGVVTMASGLDSALAGMGAEIADSQQQKEVVKVAPTGYDTVAIAQVDEYVNIRDAASTEGNVVGKLYNNCKAEILGKTDDGWYLIQSGEVTGYVSSDYFVTGSQAEALAQEVGTDMATVKGGTETLMVRSSADSNSEAISMVGDSEKLRVLEDDGDWVKVAVDDDVEGYVSKEYVDCDTEFVEAESVEQAEARKAAVQAALDKATQMQEAAYAAMNAADGNEAAYAADQANAALAEAKMLASEQEYDYEIQDLTDQIAYVAQDTSVASVWAQEAQAEEERIAAEKAAQEAAARAANPWGAGTAQGIAYDMLGQYGWGPDQMQPLFKLWARESGWRTNAGRPGGPYGIPQANPGRKMASAGADWATNPATQIRWGLSYIKGRYGSPAAAWANFCARGWY